LGCDDLAVVLDHQKGEPFRIKGVPYNIIEKVARQKEVILWPPSSTTTTTTTTTTLKAMGDERTWLAGNEDEEEEEEDVRAICVPIPTRGPMAGVLVAVWREGQGSSGEKGMDESHRNEMANMVAHVLGIALTASDVSTTVISSSPNADGSLSVGKYSDDKRILLPTEMVGRKYGGVR